MTFALYRHLPAVRPIRRLLLVRMMARIPHSAAGVLLTLHIVLILGEGSWPTANSVAPLSPWMPSAPRWFS